MNPTCQIPKTQDIDKTKRTTCYEHPPNQWLTALVAIIAIVAIVAMPILAIVRITVAILDCPNRTCRTYCLDAQAHEQGDKVPDEKPERLLLGLGGLGIISKDRPSFPRPDGNLDRNLGPIMYHQSTSH
eukprot:1348865-Amorphochlora_amoeboformis.AAC.1